MEKEEIVLPPKPKLELKILPCRARCNGKPALASKETGELHTIGRISSSSIVYMCKRCGLPTRIASVEIHALPVATDDSKWPA